MYLPSEVFDCKFFAIYFNSLIMFTEHRMYLVRIILLLEEIALKNTDQIPQWLLDFSENRATRRFCEKISMSCPNRPKYSPTHIFSSLIKKKKLFYVAKNRVTYVVFYFIRPIWSPCLRSILKIPNRNPLRSFVTFATL
jgi:hypothetical protein